MLDSVGTLIVRAYTAGGALPISGAVVRIKGAEEANRLVSYSLITDRNGITEAISLPAPSLSYSLSPSPAESPFALYDVEVSADGYYSKRINGVSVFSGINSVQLANMIPSSSGAEDYPRGNVNAQIPENDSL
ncbi:MAG: hypothetical protein E7676_03920 [Ruminococcaceae bacterium]|nr:hypothetical protein [Oscillospiraceae bacterium]